MIQHCFDVCRQEDTEQRGSSMRREVRSDPAWKVAVACRRGDGMIARFLLANDRNMQTSADASNYHKSVHWEHRITITQPASIRRQKGKHRKPLAPLEKCFS
ncbi:hypothetical protein CDAR_116991 [Caerostris darwini]|uniref:Uncharacterized protein n=1 Tax=Caerostris darwini TaxID=1538125 RepID=A0AAV4W7W2_9ARAC|nr:hypothetical protein CDAR_116991 [Caerostris darwini]